MGLLIFLKEVDVVVFDWELSNVVSKGRVDLEIVTDVRMLDSIFKIYIEKLKLNYEKYKDMRKAKKATLEEVKKLKP